MAKHDLTLDLALCLACKENQEDLVEELLRNGADANAKDPRGRPVLRLALHFSVHGRKIIEVGYIADVVLCLVACESFTSFLYSHLILSSLSEEKYSKKKIINSLPFCPSRSGASISVVVNIRSQCFVIS